MPLVENIKKLCEIKGIKIEDLSLEMGWGKNSIYRWNKNSPSVDKLIKVADYFNVTADSLLARTIVIDDFNNIDEKTKKFLTDPNSPPYILISAKAKEKGMSPETLEKLIELYTK